MGITGWVHYDSGSGETRDFPLSDDSAQAEADRQVQEKAAENMAANAGGMNPQSLFSMGQQHNPIPQPQQASEQAGWTCSCGASGNTGKFCSECGSPRPSQDNFWTCACGARNTGKFCSECGKPKPAGALQYKCDKCGWEPEDPSKPPKFCPECGDPFDNGDVKR